jgi:ribosomal protein S18 acetylase RimI-like enzyme
VRVPREDELGVVGELTAQAYLTGGALQDAGEDGYLSHLRDAAGRASDAQLLVAVDAADWVVGTVTVCRAGTRWAEIAHEGEVEMRMLAVAPQLWGRGVADALVHDVVRRARDEGARRLVLLVLDGNPTPVRLYERHGFHAVRDRDWSPYPGLLLRAYARELAGSASVG